MKAYLLIFAPVFLLPCWTMPAGKSKTSKTFPLDKVPEAVDDIYHGCEKEMEKKVEDEYFKKELVGPFKKAWEKAEECSNKAAEPVDKALTKNHMHAICVYSSKVFYKGFNEAVRTSKNTYGSTFQYHSLHYWLTTAIQILKENQDCHTTYRRTRDMFTGAVNDIIRFGTFASSSFKTDLKKFGSQTCYEIKTCLGAYLKKYEIFENEEVLIPPHETFKITEIIEGQNKFQKLKDCKRVFVLESAGFLSNLNCKLVPQ